MKCNVIRENIARTHQSPDYAEPVLSKVEGLHPGYGFLPDEKTAGLVVARHGDLFRRAAALSTVDFRAYLLVGEIQPVHQRVHGKPLSHHAGQKPGR